MTHRNPQGSGVAQLLFIWAWENCEALKTSQKLFHNYTSPQHSRHIKCNFEVNDVAFVSNNLPTKGKAQVFQKTSLKCKLQMTADGEMVSFMKWWSYFRIRQCWLLHNFVNTIKTISKSTCGIEPCLKQTSLKMTKMHKGLWRLVKPRPTKTSFYLN